MRPTAQPAERRGVVEAVLEIAVGEDGGAQALQEDAVMLRRLGRAAEAGEPRHHVGIERGPLEGLLRAHGPAHHHGEAV